jgi:hypothetical protein
VKIDERSAVAVPRRNDRLDEDTVRADHLMLVQHTFERTDRCSQNRHVQDPLVPSLSPEPVDTLHAAAACETARRMSWPGRCRRQQVIREPRRGAALLGVVLALTGAFPAHVGALVFLATFGWLSGLVLAKLYKIVAFLTRLETYGPVMGRAPTPRVQDLVSEARASKWFVIYYAAVWFGTLMLLAGQPSAFRVAAAMMTVGMVGIVREVIRARRLADVESPLRFPDGAYAPHLLFARN